MLRASVWQRQVKRFMGFVAKWIDKLKFEQQSHNEKKGALSFLFF